MNIQKMKCDIVIPIWNQFSFTKDCIESIVRNTQSPYRLILVDNASDHDTKNYLEAFKKQTPGTVLIRNEENLGFIKAVNQGLKISDASYVCVMNNDIIAGPGWLEHMIDFAETHPDAGLINPQCDGHLDTPIDEYAKKLAKRKGEYMEMNQCQGFCMLVKRDLMEKVGLLDESFGIGGFDDTDYSMRSHKAGYRSVSIYDAYVYHRQHASFNKAGNREEWVRKNQKIYYDKWGKHLRIGIPVSLDSLNKENISDVIKFAHGMAREWSWVHVWINFKGDKNIISSLINDTMKKNGLPPHQNIRVDYFNLPDIFFGLTISGKLLERIRARMKDKRFDAIVPFAQQAMTFISPIAKILKIRLASPSYSENTADWYGKGRATAVIIKEQRDSR